MGCYVIAMQYVTAGIGALAIATNPIYIAFLSLFLLKKKLRPAILLAILLGTFGVVYASLPLMDDAAVTLGGLLLLLFSMLSYSAGAIYFSARDWEDTSLLTINGWQTFLGGIMLLPVTLFNLKPEQNHLNGNFWFNTLWLVFAVSIFAVQCWLWLLKLNPVKAGIWLFLCPVFGILIASLFINEPIDYHTFIGLAAVTGALVLAERPPSVSAPITE